MVGAAHQVVLGHGTWTRTCGQVRDPELPAYAPAGTASAAARSSPFRRTAPARRRPVDPEPVVLEEKPGQDWDGVSGFVKRRTAGARGHPRLALRARATGWW
jgi:hypothetical protein